MIPTQLLPQDTMKAALAAFIELQVTVTRAMLSFREAWQGPQLAVYDPKQLLSSETVSRYDALHLVSNYEIDIFSDSAAFERAAGVPDSASAALYVELRGFRQPKLVVGFDYQATEPRAAFEDRFCRCVTAIRGLQLTTHERDSTQIQTVPLAVRELIADQWIPCLVVDYESQGALLGTLRGTPFFARDLEVDFDGQIVPYKIVVGTAALHILPELKRHFLMREKNLCDSPIIL